MLKTSTISRITALRLVGKAHMLIAQQLTNEQRQPCANCGKVPYGYAYGHSWCEECLHAQGFLPDSWNTDETWIAFRPMFLFLSERALWRSLQELAGRWDGEAESIMAALTLEHLLTGEFPAVAGCRTCAKELPEKGAISGCCSRKCYGVWYRQAKTDEIEENRIRRETERKLKLEALKAK